MIGKCFIIKIPMSLDSVMLELENSVRPSL